MNDVPDADPTPPGGDPSRPAGAPTPSQAAPEQVMDLLADHVPLALLMDLVTPDGPASADILRAEGMPDDAWWEPDEPAGEADPEGDAEDEAGVDPAVDRSRDDVPGP